MTKEANFHNVPNQNITTATSTSTPPDNKTYLEAPKQICGSKIFLWLLTRSGRGWTMDVNVMVRSLENSSQSFGHLHFFNSNMLFTF